MKIHRIAALFLSLVLAFSLAACGQGASSASSASSPLLGHFLCGQQKAKTKEQLLAEENERFFPQTILWEKVFSSMDKERDRNHDQRELRRFSAQMPWKKAKTVLRTSTRP